MRKQACAAAGFLAALLPAGAAEPVADVPAASIEVMTVDTTVDADGAFAQIRHAELKAANEAGAMQIGRINLPFSAGMQTVEVLEAYTLKPDGRKVPVDPATIYEQLPQDVAQSGMITDQRVKVLFFPQFAAGDKAVYTFKTTTAKPYFPGEFFYGDIFPRTIPYGQVRETITAPKSLGLKIENHDVAFSRKESGANIVYSWQYSAPFPKKPATALVSPLDREARFFVSSFKDYAELGRAYAELAAPKIVVTAKVKALADEITAGETNRREQARKLYEWVVKNIRYVAIELGHGSFVPHEADTILANGYGDCKDHDALLQALLKAKGIAAESLLINSGNAYSLTEAPGFTQLDHVITALPEFGLIVDASMPVAPFGSLMVSEYGKPAVRATQKNAGLTAIPLAKTGENTMRTTTVQKIAADGTVSGTTTTSAKGVFSIALRYIGYGIQALGAEKAAQSQMAARGFKDGTGKLTADPPGNLGPDYTVHGEYTAKGWESLLNNGRTYMPGGLRVLAQTGDDLMGPLYADDELATEATVCTSGSAEEDIALELPEGYSFSGVPKDTTIKTANLSFSASWKQAGNRLSVHRRFSSRIDTALCSGAVRKETAAALKRIRQSYDENFDIVKPGGGVKVDDAKRAEARPFVLRGNQRLDAGETDAAIAEYDAALVIDPQFSWALNGRAVAYMRQGKYERAIADLSRAIEIAPEYKDAYYNRGDAYLRQRQWDNAKADFDQALRIDPQYVSALLGRGLLYLNKSEFTKARADYTAAIAAVPETAAAYAGRATAYLNMDERKAAQSDVTEALKLDSKNARALAVRGFLAMTEERNGPALKDFSDALALDGEDSMALAGRAQLYRRAGKNALAVADLDRLLAQAPREVTFLKLRADLHREMKNYALALADYDRLHDLARDLASERYRLLTLAALGREKDARAECAKLLADNPDKGWPLIACSGLKRRLGDNAGANADVAKALKIEPSLAQSGSIW